MGKQGVGQHKYTHLPRREAIKSKYSHPTPVSKEEGSPYPVTDEEGTQVERDHLRGPILKTKWPTPGV